MIKVWLGYLVRLPKFLFLLVKDLIPYIKNRSWLNFDGWGLHLYVGKFGAGKTCTMVHDAYALAKRYPKLTIVTNLQLSGFPAHTQILPLRSPQDILNAPVNTLVLIDEIGTIFNSRDFAASKQSVPKILFQHLCQCRKRHMQIYATTQRWNFLDKQLRDITDTVRVTRSHLSHPFTRICTVYTYDAVEYDLSFSNPQYPLAAIDARVYCQTDADRNRYDTQQLIDNMLQADYISDEEYCVIGESSSRKSPVRSLTAASAGSAKTKLQNITPSLFAGGFLFAFWMCHCVLFLHQFFMLFIHSVFHVVCNDNIAVCV